MPGTERSEVIFVAAMMILIMIVSITAVYFFFRTYKKEMREKSERQNAELKGKNEGSLDPSARTTDH